MLPTPQYKYVHSFAASTISQAIIIPNKLLVLLLWLIIIPGTYNIYIDIVQKSVRLVHLYFLLYHVYRYYRYYIRSQAIYLPQHPSVVVVMEQQRCICPKEQVDRRKVRPMQAPSSRTARTYTLQPN